MQLTWGVATDPGRVRALNEDAVVAGPAVFAVADGMGGAAAGDVASGLVAQRLLALGVLPGSLRVADLENAIGAAQQDIAERVSVDARVAGMGTTLSGLAAIDAGGSPHWYVFNVGDSRTYRHSRGALEQLTVDHSEVQELIQAGQLTADQAKAYSRRNIITRAIGPDDLPPVDSWLFPAAVGDRFLVCSDGLVNELSDTAILNILDGQPDDQRAAEQLVDEAVAAGGRDNVSVVLAGLVSLDQAGDVADEDTAPRPLRTLA